MHRSIASAESPEAAVALIRAFPSPVDSPTQRRLRSPEVLAAAFAAARRRADRVWVVRDDGAPRGVVAANRLGRDWVLDVFGFADDGARDALLAHLAAGAKDAGVVAAGLFALPGRAASAPFEAAMEQAGWRRLVRRYHLERATESSSSPAVSLRFERVTSAADPRLVRAHRAIMLDSLDAYDLEALAEHGPHGSEAGVRAGLESLVESGPIESIRLALDAEGDVVGLVSGRSLTDRRGAVLYVGVIPSHRGRGHARQMLSWMTATLAAEGAERLVADTDEGNAPMVRAFLDTGWSITEARIDFVPPRA